MSDVDLIVIGAGPSGLVTALWAARQGLTICVIDKKDGPVERGHADGIEPRTLEILDSFGVADSIWQKANKTVEICTWSDSKGKLQRISRRPNYARGVSRYQEATLHQGHIERALVSALDELPNVKIHWQSMPTKLEATPSPEQTSPSVKLSWRKGISDIKETQACYVVGCDGAHSWTRKQLGIQMIGNNSEELWGVVDIVPQTNFPDIRCRCVIQNGSETMMIIPREQHMVRFYVPLGDMQYSPRLQDAGQFDIIVARIRKILAPYWFNFDICDWWSSYRIKQQIATHFSDSLSRVFLAGDAIHTHSPKAGQGMNVSIQDAWNIGWKLVAAVKGQATQAILESYEIERRPVAQRLLSFDRKMLECFRSLCKETTEHETETGPASNSLDRAVTEEHSTASGIEVTYNGLGLQSVSTALSTPDMASGIKLGYRFGDFNVLRHADGYVDSIHRVLPANGHWRVIVFPGDIEQSKQKARLDLLGGKLAHLKLLPRFLTLGILAEYEPILIHAASRDRVELMDLPGVFRPWCPWGLDAARVFADYPTYHHDQHFPVYRELGISRDAGCLVILRPDQHVSFIGKLDVLLQDIPTYS